MWRISSRRSALHCISFGWKGESYFSDCEILLGKISCNINMSDTLLLERVFLLRAPEFGVFVIRHFECGSINIPFHERSVVCVSAFREDVFGFLLNYLTTQKRLTVFYTRAISPHWHVPVSYLLPTFEWHCASLGDTQFNNEELTKMSHVLMCNHEDFAERLNMLLRLWGGGSSEN